MYHTCDVADAFRPTTFKNNGKQKNTHTPYDEYGRIWKLVFLTNGEEGVSKRRTTGLRKYLDEISFRSHHLLVCAPPPRLPCLGENWLRKSSRGVRYLARYQVCGKRVQGTQNTRTGLGSYKPIAPPFYHVPVVYLCVYLT